MSDTPLPDRHRVPVPQRRSTPPEQTTEPPKPVVSSTPQQNPAPKTPEDLASDRASFGFDDIPVGDEPDDDTRFRDVFSAWAKQTIKLSPVEKKLEEQKAKAKQKHRRLNAVKENIKWAMQADLDEPVAPRRQVPPSSQTPQPSSQKPESKTIDININFGSLPKFPSLRKHFPSKATVQSWLKQHVFTRKGLWVALGCALLVAGYFGVLAILNHMDASRKTGSGDQSPTYETVLPSGKSIDDLGGWKRVSPPDRDPVFAYSDKIENTAISVSQQPLPEPFKNDTDKKVAELAESFGAATKIEANGITAHIGTSAKGPQSTIIAKDGTLILIKSQATLSQDAWKTYIQTLK